MPGSDRFRAVVQESLMTGAVVRFRAGGASMHPTIRDGEVIMIAPVRPDEVVSGDVLLCRHQSRVLAHRVVGLSGPGARRVFHLRGDAKAACDAPVGSDAVIGRVISVWRNGRDVMLCGGAARLRYTLRRAASRAKARAKALLLYDCPTR